MSLRLPTTKLLAIVPALILAVLSTSVLADGRKNQDHSPHSRRVQEERKPEQARPRISASQAVAIVQQRYDGKVLNVSTNQGKNSVTYNVKILQSSGHMRTIKVDGQSGAILN